MLKKLTAVAFALSLVGFGVLGYIEVSARVSQERMKSTWDGIDDSQGKNGKTDPKKHGSKSKKRKNKSAERDDQGVRQLAINKRGPDRDQLGLLTIPKIGVEQVILYGAGPEMLRRGPGLIKDMQYPGRIGNAVIAGHRTSYGFPFRRLDELKIGDKIIFKNGSGRMVYKVKKKFRVSPDDRSVLNQPKKKTRLTLLSCDPPFRATYRLIIVAEAS